MSTGMAQVTTAPPELRYAGGPSTVVDPAPAAREVGGLVLPVGAFVGAQLAVMLVAVVESVAHGTTVVHELTIWDGQWYLRLAAHGYPGSMPHGQSTLGFLPLYPAAMWLVSHVTGLSLTTAGLLTDRAGGLVSTVLVYRLSTIWWGTDAGRRATLLYAFFPGAVVFSLVYADGLFMALVVGCLLCLEQRRWWWAGVLAALATGTGADGFAVVACCATAAALHIWRDRVWEGNWRELRCLAAPVLAPLGLIGFAGYLWIHTGDPMASFDAQWKYWGNHVDALSMWRTYRLFLRLNGSLTLAIGLVGVPFVLGTRYLLVKARHRPPGPVLVWGFGVTVLSLVSAGLTPNPRMLLFAFPSAIVLGCALRGRSFAAVVVLSAMALVGLCWLVFSGAVLP